MRDNFLLKNMEVYMSELNIEINEFIDMSQFLEKPLKKEDIKKLQKEMLNVEEVNAENYIRAVNLAHKIYLLCVSKYRYANGKFANTREWLSLAPNEISLKRTINSGNILDITYIATMELPAQLPRITASHLIAMEKALLLNNANDIKNIKKNIIKSSGTPDDSKIITSKLMDAMLAVGKEDTFLVDSKSKTIEFGKAEITLTKPSYIAKTNYTEEETLEIKQKHDKNYALTEIDAQNCMMLYSFAKHYQNKFKDNKLFFSLTTVGDFIDKNFKGSNGDAFVESVKRLSRLQIQYEFNGDCKNKTVSKILKAYYGDNFEETELKKFTTNYLFAEIAEGETGVYFAMQFPLMNIFDALGQFEDNVDPRVFAHSNSNEYVIVTIAFKLAALSFMNKSSGSKKINLYNFIDSIGLMNSYATNSNKARFLNKLCNRLEVASSYVKNIKPIKILTTPRELQDTCFTIEYVNTLPSD